MINSMADMLAKLKEEEEKKIDEFREIYSDTPHPTIIGDMYEGLTKNLLEKTIFEGFDIKVVSGQISNSQGELSNEIDCMIVEGEGTLIPNTDKYIYNISNVLAVIEVKKNLHKSDLIDSYFKMVNLNKMFDPREMSTNEFRLFRDAFRSITRTEVPKHEEISNYSLEIQMVYHTLLVETLMPLRIVFGFYGYSSLQNLQRGFTNLLMEHVSDESEQITGFDPGSFPNQIFTRHSSLVKANGMPYNSPLDEDNYWNVYVLSSHNPILHFLELFWTKLSYKHDISSDFFGNDLELEGFFQYLKAKPRRSEGELAGWEYQYTEIPEDYDTSPFYFKWEPQELKLEEFILVNALCDREPINTYSDFFLDLLSRAEENESSFLESLKQQKIVYKDDQNDLYLLTDECFAGISREGKYYAGENKDGRMMEWLLS